MTVKEWKVILSRLISRRKAKNKMFTCRQLSRIYHMFYRDPDIVYTDDIVEIHNHIRDIGYLRDKVIPKPVWMCIDIGVGTGDWDKKDKPRPPKKIPLRERRVKGLSFVKPYRSDNEKEVRAEVEELLCREIEDEAKRDGGKATKIHIRTYNIFIPTVSPRLDSDKSPVKTECWHMHAVGRYHFAENEERSNV